MVDHRDHRRRLDRRAQIGVVVLAAVAGVVAGMLGTHRGLGREPTRRLQPDDPRVTWSSLVGTTRRHPVTHWYLMTPQQGSV